jgi:hypothetical protein
MHTLTSAHTLIIRALVAVAATVSQSIITVMSISGSITAESIPS